MTVKLRGHGEDDAEHAKTCLSCSLQDMLLDFQDRLKVEPQDAMESLALVLGAMIGQCANGGMPVVLGLVGHFGTIVLNVAIESNKDKPMVH